MGSSNTGAKEDSALDGGDNNNHGDHFVSETSFFSEGEKVLAYHGPRIYEAKVQKTELRKKEWKYFVHYLGWNKNWDEWVSVDRLMKFTEENVRKQRTIVKNQGADKNLKSARGAQSRPKGSDAKVDKEDLRNYVARGKKRKASSGAEKDTDSTEKLVKLQFPPTLKKQLVDDWEFVTQLGKLVKLPRTPTVDDVLKKYLEHRSKKDGMIAESIGEILSGLRNYFDKALRSMLLYKKERQQYHDAIPENSTISPSSVYGAEHLLRLFVKLPELLANVNMEEEALMRLQQKLLDILKFLQKNQSTFFLSTYDGYKGLEETDNKEENNSAT